jgi:deoxycytidylate deaminase
MWEMLEAFGKELRKQKEWQIFNDMMIKKQDKYYMDLALQVSKGSKCIRAQYGTVIVSSAGHIVSTGYNGKPAGSCNDGICYRVGLPPNAPKENCCLHSEVNAITFAGRERCLGATLYVSGIPCNDCALVQMQSGIVRLVYFDGAALTGHRGCSNNDYWEKYGSKIERVAFTYEAWEELYGGSNCSSSTKTEPSSS